MTFSLEELVFFFCVLMRISGFVYTAPFFNNKSVPRRVKAGFSIVMAVIIFSVLPHEPLEYESVIDFAAIVIKEVLLGVILGFFANVSFYILGFAGHLIDMEIGFSMAQEFDPVSSTTVTITSNLYSYAVTLMLMVTYMHHYMLKAFIDTYALIPVDGMNLNINIYRLFTDYLTDYFIIAFRIVLPMFAVILTMNVVLGILAKVASQMNMFVVGMQLKVLTGLVILIFMMGMLMNVSGLIFDEMIYMLKSVIQYMNG